MRASFRQGGIVQALWRTKVISEHTYNEKELLDPLVMRILKSLSGSLGRASGVVTLRHSFTAFSVSTFQGPGPSDIFGD